MSQEHDERYIATLLHGRYLVDRGDGGEGRPLLVGFHGYAEHAERHLDELRKIPGADGWVLCSVGALHRFYNPKTGDVIGSWMTRQGREQAIDDNARYAASVISKVRREERPSGVLVLAGFSQGCPMAYRAALRCGFRVHGLLILAGDVPAEVHEDGALGLPPVLLGRGIRDEIYKAEQMDKDLEALARRGVEVETCVFDGGHEWGQEYLEAAGCFLRRVSAGA